MFNCVYKIISLYQSDWNDVVSFIYRDLHNISELDNSNSASAECIGNVLQSQLLLTQVSFHKNIYLLDTYHLYITYLVTCHTK
jgi:hypothetical protein